VTVTDPLLAMTVVKTVWLEKNSGDDGSRRFARRCWFTMPSPYVTRSRKQRECDLSRVTR